jgi:hypothetical protein
MRGVRVVLQGTAVEFEDIVSSVAVERPLGPVGWHAQTPERLQFVESLVLQALPASFKKLVFFSSYLLLYRDNTVIIVVVHCHTGSGYANINVLLPAVHIIGVRMQT